VKLSRFYLLALAVILVDQSVKLLVYYNMDLNSEFNVFGDWFRIHYLLNPGMAFGWKSDHMYGKLVLTLFRLLAMVAIGWYIYYLFRKEAKAGLLWCMALILGGAVGNVIDSTFYGVLLDNAPINAPTPWFHGQVIDMLFFPIFSGYYPDWLPYVGGNRFLFFSPVFNIADSAIFIGVVTILIFQKRFFHDTHDHILDAEETDDVDSQGEIIS
jgi:signal peptidase II